MGQIIFNGPSLEQEIRKYYSQLHRREDLANYVLTHEGIRLGTTGIPASIFAQRRKVQKGELYRAVQKVSYEDACKICSKAYPEERVRIATVYYNRLLPAVVDALEADPFLGEIIYRDAGSFAFPSWKQMVQEAYRSRRRHLEMLDNLAAGNSAKLPLFLSEETKEYLAWSAAAGILVECIERQSEGYSGEDIRRLFCRDATPAFAQALQGSEARLHSDYLFKTLKSSQGKTYRTQAFSLRSRQEELLTLHLQSVGSFGLLPKSQPETPLTTTKMLNQRYLLPLPLAEKISELIQQANNREILQDVNKICREAYVVVVQQLKQDGAEAEGRAAALSKFFNFLVGAFRQYGLPSVLEQGFAKLREETEFALLQEPDNRYAAFRKNCFDLILSE